MNRSELNASLKDIGQMLSQAQIRPFFNAGTPDGFQVNQIRQGSIFQKMGIQEGDIIQNLDDRKVQTGDDMVTLFNTLKSAPQNEPDCQKSGARGKNQLCFQLKHYV